jgi:hypothetical protein
MRSVSDMLVGRGVAFVHVCAIVIVRSYCHVVDVWFVSTTPARRVGAHRAIVMRVPYFAKCGCVRVLLRVCVCACALCLHHALTQADDERHARAAYKRDHIRA